MKTIQSENTTGSHTFLCLGNHLYCNAGCLLTVLSHHKEQHQEEYCYKVKLLIIDHEQKQNTHIEVISSVGDEQRRETAICQSAYTEKNKSHV